MDTNPVEINVDEPTPEQAAIIDVQEAERFLKHADNATEHADAVTALMDANDRLALIQGRPGNSGVDEPAGLLGFDPPYEPVDPCSLPEFLAEVERRAAIIRGDDGLADLMSALPQESGARKKIPLFSGVLKYFPAALVGVARVSMMGNDKHNPGQPLHHSRGKSSDHADCILRHLVETSEGENFNEFGIPSVAYVAWRALALCQEWYEEHGNAPLAPGAKAA